MTGPIRDRRPAIVVAGLDDGPEASWGPFVLACLPPGRFRRVGVVCHHAESGAYRGDLLEAVHRVTPPDDDYARFAADLAALIRSERARAVIAGSRSMIDAIARAHELLRKGGVTVVAPKAAQLGRLTTWNLVAACGRARIPHVRTIEFPAAGVSGLPADLRYPVTLVCEDRPAARVHDASQLVETAYAWLASLPHATRGRGADAAARLLVQDRDHDRAFEVAAVCDARGRMRSYAAVRVLATDGQGRPWLAVTVADPELRDAAGRVAAALGVEGPVVISFEGGGGQEWRAADARAGFPMWVELAHAAGVPLVLDSVGDAADGAAKRPAFAAGMLFSQTAEDWPIDLAQPVRLAGCQ